MRGKQKKWARFVVVIFVTLSLAFLPVLSQQAMAAHHVNDELSLAATANIQEHVATSCSEKSNTQSSDLQMNCCDMSCSSFASFGATEVSAVQIQVTGHFEFDSEQLTSRITFGLKRPPRV